MEFTKERLGVHGGNYSVERNCWLSSTWLRSDFFVVNSSIIQSMLVQMQKTLIVSAKVNLAFVCATYEQGSVEHERHEKAEGKESL